MQIIHIIPGSGNSFYCGNCLRDSKYVHALRALGHDVIKVPMYLPLFAEENGGPKTPVFYGAISIYLKQSWPAFRHAPAWIDRLLNAKPALKLAAHMAGSTRATGLEEMTVSMLQGEEGQQQAELDHMVNWIGEHLQPDVIHLSNALLLGLAHRLKEQLDVPVLCSLQDEDVWVDVMEPDAARRVWSLMAEKAAHVDHFIAVSDYYRRAMGERLQLPDDKLRHLHLGVDLPDYEFRPADRKPKNIGFLSRLCKENGLDILVDAFIDLKKKPAAKSTRLVLSGGHTGDDKPFLRAQKRKLRQAGLMDEVVFHEDFSEAGRQAFFEQVALLSVPVPRGEAFGIYLLEAMASGIPVAQPNLGAFPEIIKTSGGGVVYEPNRPEHLAQALHSVLFDEDRLAQLSANGREGVEEHFCIRKQGGRMVEVYERVVRGGATLSTDR